MRFNPKQDKWQELITMCRYDKMPSGYKTIFIV